MKRQRKKERDTRPNKSTDDGFLIDNDLSSEKVIKKSVTTVTIMVFGILFAFGSQLVLARSVDPALYGEFIADLAAAGIFALITSFGMGMYQIRIIPRYRSGKNLHLINGFYRTANIVLIMTSLVSITVLFVLYHRNNEIYWFLALIPCLGYFSFYNNTLKTLGMTHVANLFEPALKNVSFVILFLLAEYFFGKEDGNLIYVAFITSTTCLILSQIIISFRRLKPFSREYSTDAKDWATVSFSMILVAGSYLIFVNTDVLLIRLLLEPENVASYFVALKLASVSFLLASAVKMILAPIASKLYYEKRFSELEYAFRKGTYFSLVAALVFLFLGWTLGEMVLEFYGENYASSFEPFLILTVGYIFVISLGPSDTILLMTSYEKVTLYTYFLGVFVNVVLNIVFITRFGVNGAALATAIAMSIQSFITFMLLKHRLKINLSIFGV